MANMFSNKERNDIPKTLSDCIKPDATVENLHAWAERLESWGAYFCIILLVIGIISTCMNVYAVSSEEELILGTALSSLVTWGIYIIIAFCSFHVFALLISALATITQNTIISANVALYESAQNAPAFKPDESHTPVESKAPEKAVAKEAPKAVSKEEKQTAIAPIQVDATTIECPTCHTTQNAARSVCWSCGQRFNKD